MNESDSILFKDLFRNLIFLLILVFGRKWGRKISEKYPKNIPVQILLSEDRKDLYYFWFVSTIILSILLLVLLKIDFWICLTISIILILSGMTFYFKMRDEIP